MNEMYREAVQRAVKKHVGNRKKVVECKSKIHYPQSAEREYIRLAKEIDQSMTDVIRESIPKIIEICNRRYNDTHRFDDSQHDDLSDLEKVFNRALKKITSITLQKSLKKRLTQIANTNRKLTVREWKRAIKKTLGIDLFEDYYNGGNYQKLVDVWIDNNVQLITSVPAASLDEMKKVVFDGWYESKSTKAIVKDLQNKFDVSKNKAEFLAVDQTSKLNSQLTQFQQTDAGIEEYIWDSAGDSRVRKSHRKLDGKTFRWDDPPVVDEKNGRRCHPGEDYRCRCIAIPKFKIESLNLPIKEKDWDAIDKRMADFYKNLK